MRTFSKAFNSHLNNTKVPRKIFFKGLNQHFALPANQVLKMQRTWWHSSIKIHGAKTVSSLGMRFHAPSWWVAAVQKHSPCSFLLLASSSCFCPQNSLDTGLTHRAPVNGGTGDTRGKKKVAGSPSPVALSLCCLPSSLTASVQRAHQFYITGSIINEARLVGFFWKTTVTA